MLDQGLTLQYLAGSPGIWYNIGDDTPLGQLDARYGATISTLSSWTGAEVLNVATAQVWNITLSGNVTSVSFTNASFQTSVAQNLTLYISQPSTGGTYTYTVGGWTGVTWFGGSPPVIATGMPAAMTVLTFQSLDGGQTWQGGIVSNAALPLPVEDGGTGLNTLTTYELLAGGTGTTSPVQQIGAGTSGYVLTSAGSGALPTWTSPSAGTSSNWTAADQGLIAWNYDGPASAEGSSAPLATGGVMYVMAVKVPAATITNILLAVVTNGATLTSGQCFAALYQGGTLLGQTSDQSSNWETGTTRIATMAISGGAVTVTAGIVYVAAWFNGTTGPAFFRSRGPVGGGEHGHRHPVGDHGQQRDDDRAGDAGDAHGGGEHVLVRAVVTLLRASATGLSFPNATTTGAVLPAATYNTVILADTPKGFWDWNGTDLTGNPDGNNATLTGSPATTVMPNGDLAMTFGNSASPPSPAQYATIPTRNYFSPRRPGARRRLPASSPSRRGSPRP